VVVLLVMDHHQLTLQVPLFVLLNVLPMSLKVLLLPLEGLLLLLKVLLLPLLLPLVAVQLVVHQVV
jgi:hypothetical protein